MQFDVKGYGTIRLVKQDAKWGDKALRSKKKGGDGYSDYLPINSFTDEGLNKIADYNNYREIPAFTLGGYDIDKFAPNQTLTWNYLTDDTYWTVRLSGVSLGNRTITPSTSNAIVDTGTSYLAMPENEFQSFLGYW